MLQVGESTSFSVRRVKSWLLYLDRYRPIRLNVLNIRIRCDRVWTGMKWSAVKTMARSSSRSRRVIGIWIFGKSETIAREREWRRAFLLFVQRVDWHRRRFRGCDMFYTQCEFPGFEWSSNLLWTSIVDWRWTDHPWLRFNQWRFEFR